MGWESFGVVRFNLGPLLQGQMIIIKLKSDYNSLIITPQPLRAVGVLFSPMVSRWAAFGKKFVWAVSQKP